MEVFTSEDVSKVLWKKLVVVIGDSIQRCVYKDLVCLLSPGSKTRYLSSKELKAKGEINFLNDKLMQGGQLGDVKTGINYREVRQYDSGTSIVKFYFVTRCYSDHLESILNELKTIQPHAVIMNSCLWDLHRYGPRGPDSYHNNMKKLMEGLKRVIPNDAVFIWNSTLPLDSKCRGGFLLPYFENIPSQEIIEANFVASDIVLCYGFIYLDLHSIFVNQLHHRANDGIHWNHFAHRRISNLILLHLCRIWNMPVPRTMPLDIPREPRLHPLTERPHNTSLGSYTSHLHIDRFGFNSSADARYIVQKPTNNKPNSYKDRFRLMGSPIITSSTVVSKNNQNLNPLTPGLGSNARKGSELLPMPIHSSSPIETNSKSKSFLQQNECISSGSPISQELFNPKQNQSCKESSMDARITPNIHLSVNSKTHSPYFSNATGTKTDEDRENTLPNKALTSTLPQSSTSTLVVQVSHPCLTENGDYTKEELTTCTVLNKPALPTPRHMSDTPVMSSCVTKATPCVDKENVKNLPPTIHVSQLSIPINQVTSSQVTKTTPCIDHVCAPLNKVIPPTSHVSSMPVDKVKSSVTNTTQSTDKANAPCSIGNRDTSLADLLSTVEPSRIMEILASAITKVSSPQHKVAMSAESPQQGSLLNTKSQKPKPNIIKSSVDAVGVTTVKTCKQVDNTLIANRNTSNKNNDSSKLINKPQTSGEVTSSTERRFLSKDLKCKATDDVTLERQPLQQSAISNTCGKSKAESYSKEKAPSTKSSNELSSRSGKRKATADVDSIRNNKQSKIGESEKKKKPQIADSRKPSNDLKRKASSLDNTSQQHSLLGLPPAKRDRNEHNSNTTPYSYTISSEAPISGQYSTVTNSSRVGQAAIPVHLGNHVETRNQPAQDRCIPSYQSNCYWMEGQRSLQDVQQQQLWFNTLLSRGRASAWRNPRNMQQSMYYNQHTRSWQFYNNQFYDNGYRY